MRTRVVAETEGWMLDWGLKDGGEVASVKYVLLNVG